MLCPQNRPNRTATIVIAMLLLSISFAALPAFAAIFQGGFSGKEMEGSRKLVLTFDDGPGDFDKLCETYIRIAYPGYDFTQSTTENMLTLIARYAPLVNGQHPISATFFLKGDILARRPEIARLLVSYGHQLENHSFLHRNSLAFTDTKMLIEDLSKTHNLIKSTTGMTPQFFRPPYGAWSDRLMKVFSSDGVLSNYRKPVMWNIDSMDWYVKRDCNIALISSYMVKTMYLKQGGIILMHDIHAISVAALKRFFDHLIEENRKIEHAGYYRGEAWQFITLEEAYDRFDVEKPQ